MHATKKTLSSLLPLGITLALALPSVGCGPTVFQGQTGLSVMGALPAPPPPPPPPPPKVEKRVKIVDNKIVITEKIQFAYDKAMILDVSHGLLDEIVKVLKDNAHVKKVQIAGHASDEGRGKAAANYNKRLSDRRAKAVMQYFTSKGVDAKRLEAKGFGIDKPITSNDTDAGREKNRRVEFNILEQDVTKREVTDD